MSPIDLDVQQRDPDLPTGWDRAKFGEIYELAHGKSLTKAARNTDGDFPVYGSNGIVGHHDTFLVEGPLLVVGRKGAVGAVSFSVKPCWPIDTTYYVRHSEHIDIRFSFYLLTSLRLNQLDRSTAIPGLNRNDAYGLVVDLPPLSEQRRIVAKIEELFSELDKGVESLKKARKQLKIYRQSVLKHAFEGKLTAKWREENKDKLETPEQLLTRIKQEREERYEKQLQKWKTAVKEWEKGGKMAKKPAKLKRPRSFSDFAQNQSLTDMWPIFELGDLIGVSSGQSLTSKDMRGGRYPVYGGNGITGYHDEYLVSEPTLIIGRVGAKCGVIHIALANSWITDNALIASPLIRSFDQHYFKFLLEHKNLNILGSSTGQPVISGAKIYPVHILLPTLAEQILIGDTIERANSSIDELNAEINNQLLKADALRQSILKKAFSGRLVPQNPNDEPASILLERIKAEKTARSQKNTRAKRRRTAATA